jgi:biopolymer transport protein ExbD
VKLSLTQRKGPLINLIPILDSIFILIFIFMMALMQRAQRSEIKLSLPSSTQKPSLLVAKSLAISLDTSGQIYLEGQKVSKKDLQNELQLLKLENSALPIVITGDKKVNLGLVIEVLDLAKKNGFRNVTIETSFKKSI